MQPHSCYNIFGGCNFPVSVYIKTLLNPWKKMIVLYKTLWLILSPHSKKILDSKATTSWSSYMWTSHVLPMFALMGPSFSQSRNIQVEFETWALSCVVVCVLTLSSTGHLSRMDPLSPNMCRDWLQKLTKGKADNGWIILYYKSYTAVHTTQVIFYR